METTHASTWFEVPARHGRAFAVRAGQALRVIDVDGGQVGDLFAFAAADVTEYLSAAHTRTSTGRLFPRVGEQFVTNRRRPILTLSADTSPGVHDMLIAACDPERYRTLGVTAHRSCATNLEHALATLGVVSALVPQPVNVFMNIPVDAYGQLRWLPAVSRAGDYVSFDAEMDCTVVVSACPMDLNAINGDHPTALGVEIIASKTVTSQEVPK